MLIEYDAQVRPAQQLREQALAFLNGLTPQIPAVELQQVECTMNRAGERTVAADQVKDGKPVFITDDRFAVDQARANRQFAHYHRDKRKARREVISL